MIHFVTAEQRTEQQRTRRYGRNQEFGSWSIETAYAPVAEINEGCVYRLLYRKDGSSEYGTLTLDGMDLIPTLEVDGRFEAVRQQVHFRKGKKGECSMLARWIMKRAVEEFAKLRIHGDLSPCPKAEWSPLPFVTNAPGAAMCQQGAVCDGPILSILYDDDAEQEQAEMPMLWFDPDSGFVQMDGFIESQR